MDSNSQDKEAYAANTQHIDNVDASSDSLDDHGFTTDSKDLPPGYFTSTYFLGTMFATGFALCAGVAGFAFAAPNLAVINADIGPDPNYVWIGLVYTLALAVSLLLVGRLSDLFGRRWFFISGQLLAVVGCIVVALAPTIKAVIGGMTLISLAASTQLSFGIVSNELVPMKWRFFTHAWLYLWCIPCSGFGPVISKAFILNTKAGWRGPYWLLVGINLFAGILYYLFYFPPTFHMKFATRSKMQQVKDLDYTGIFLFTAGLLLFLMGLSWGGSVYPWKSAATISTIVIGLVVLVIFVCYEAYAPLKEPILPLHLFKKFSWVACSSNLGLGASVYYGMAIIWPQMVAVLYTDDGGASIHAGFLSSLIGLMIIAGQLVGGVLAVHIGKTKIQCITILTIAAALLGAMASCGPDDFVRATVLICLGCFFVGWNETLCLANAGIDIDDQREIGTAIGAAGSMRSAISTVASTVYVVILVNGLTAKIPAIVPPAVVAAGLPSTSVVPFLTGFTTGNFTAIEGLTPQILAVGVRAYKVANAEAYKKVFLSSLIFSGIAIVLSVFTPNVDEKMTNQVAATLHQKGNENVINGDVVIEKGIV